MTYKYNQFATEQQLFNFLKANFISDLKPTKKLTSIHDCYSIEYNLDVELKCRRKHYDDLIIEKKKYKSLMDRCRDFGTIPVYINSTPKGVWGFYLQNLEIKWEHKNLPKKTDFADRRTISKEIGYLKVSEGVDLVLLLSSFP